MQPLVLASLLVALGSTLGLPAVPSPPALRYHDAVGFRLAELIRAAEESRDFDGSRIVGGSPAPLGAFPYMAGLVIHFPEGSSVCGSSLVSNSRLVTAAHCWWDGGRQALGFTVVLGSVTVFSGGTRVNTSDVRMHPAWNPNNIQNDIAVIAIPWVNYSNTIRNIALPSGALLNNNFAGVWATASGFGLQADGVGLSPSQALHHVNLQVITNAVCQQTYGPAFVVESTLCTSGAAGGNVCSSDSGGPLAVSSGGHNVLIGVVSFGSGSCETPTPTPSAYARVTAFVPWLQSQL